MASVGARKAGFALVPRISIRGATSSALEARLRGGRPPLKRANGCVRTGSGGATRAVLLLLVRAPVFRLLLRSRLLPPPVHMASPAPSAFEHREAWRVPRAGLTGALGET